MQDVDLNLLIALDALLAESSVVGAARRLGLSPSAMSRTLARLRAATNDPLLVRAGRRLVPTPHAARLREAVSTLSRQARAALQPAAKDLNLASLERSFTVRANEAFVQVFAARLVAAVTRSAPSVRLRFAPKPDKDPHWLREGLADLEIGVLGQTGPELRVQALFTDQYVGAVRPGHSLLEGEITVERFAAFGHVVVSSHSPSTDPVDEALGALGLSRQVMVVATSFPAALAIACASDLVAHVTETCISTEPGQYSLLGSQAIGFRLPVKTPAIVVSQMWHPRMDADPGHRWLRALVQSVCRKRPTDGPLNAA